ncbi:hypothetical protein QUF75_05050 [Desulfococcaceae bacterium HSG7]|nr:hypothetical protein [Desulfococcaceae bacterium HSG7]
MKKFRYGCYLYWGISMRPETIEQILFGHTTGLYPLEREPDSLQIHGQLISTRENKL